LIHAALQQHLQHSVPEEESKMATRKATSPQDKQTEVAETISTLYTKSVARLADAQKKTLDMALQQNAEVIGAWKKIAKSVPDSPIPSILDLAGSMFGQLVDLQKGAIDLALEQSNALAGLAGERADFIAKAGDTVKTIVQDTVQRAAATQKNVIEFSAIQTKTAFDTFKKQAGVAGTPAEAAADSIQRGFETLLDTQKEILNIASKRTA
jgi:dsDNA-binding SOS-regulon protein